ncbi:MAG: hypothetical protein J3R72DRAFT_503436 [Linnemannia gamsii]|nr:MAG: hypothetical protein J3R72DRAFT_503436 [Linnemannia gamsii]
MSKNPYFAHLPTWRNRQDLAYAIDSLPTILETLTASSPLLATYSYPSTTPSSTRSTSPSSSASGSLSSSQSSSYSSSSSSSASSSSTTITASPMSPSSTSYSSPSSSNTSSYVPSSSTSATGSSSPAKSKASAFKERFVLDLAKECHRSLTKSPSPPPVTSTAAITTSNNVSTATNTPTRRVSGSVQHQQQNQQQHQDQNNRNVVASSYYPLQFSTRARAMAYLIEILQSLQKEHCGCDLVKGCYCGQDGIEDHEGKSPCYVCGEWYPDRRDSIRNVGGGSEGDMDSTRRQGKSWHEQGSLRHHVAEAKVKKWLDSVWKPPLAPATTPEQDNVRQFGLRSQEDLRQCFDHPHYQQQHHQYQQQQQQQQQHSARMESGRPWSVHDIEIEARAKSRSRNNSASSNSSMSFAASPSAYYPPTTSSYAAPSPQQDLSGSAYGYGSGSGQWHFTTSPATHSAGSSYASPSSKSIQATPPSQRAGSLFWAPPPPPPLPVTDSYAVQSFDVDNHGYQARVRTMSCTDAPPPTGNASLYLGTPISSLRSSTPPVMRSNNYHTNHVNSTGNNNSSSNGIDKHGRSKPVRASTTNSTFSIPQEILDPNYRSPTFRIKSWSPSSSSSTGNDSSSSASPASSAFPPIASRLSFLKESSPSSAGGNQPQKKQTLDGWTAAAEEKIKSKSSSSSPSELSSSAQESVLKSSKMNQSDQEDCCIAASPPPEASGQQGNTREDPTSPTSASSSGSPVAAEGLGAGAGVGGVRAFEGEEVKKSAPFQFNFTSTRFRAAVQAKASMDSLKSAAVAQTRVGSERGGGGVQSESVQKSTAVLDEGVLHVQSRSMTATADNNNIKSVSDGGRHKNRVKAIVGTTISIPVDVVIITEETVLRETDEDLEELVDVTVSIASSKTPTPTGPSSPSRSTNTLLSIQKSAPMSPPIFLSNGGSGSASALASVKSTHSHHHHLTVTTSSPSSSSTASTSASASSSALHCSQDPRSPNKSSCGDIQRARSWVSLQKWMQTMTVTATTTITATTTTLPSQSGSMLHVDTASSSS